MNKKEQKQYFKDVHALLKEKRFTIAWILYETGISRSHWHFMRNGSRSLIDDTKAKIDFALRQIK